MPEVLVVDDSVSVRKALEFSLAPHGLTVLGAPSAEEALQTLSAHPGIDLVIADIVMPGMGGFELCREVRSHPDLAGLPVLLMSGVVNDGMYRQAQEAGAAGLLKKPFTSGGLLPVVQRAMRGPQVTKGPGSPAPTSPAAPAEPPRPSAPPSRHAALLGQLAEAPGMVSAAAYGRDGRVLTHVGEALPDEVGSYVRFFLGAAEGLGAHVRGQGLNVLQIEFAQRTLLLARDGDALYTCLLREASSAGIVKYLLRQVVAN
ncbi:transcriptional regulator (plasmid) [Deinococcus aetherius]|uniref:Transcriptional regulator n=1 Tax=Deinococcus aetherius TaxID=200252 RepID=A0ABM8AI11_9DEIO|nr:response regulator [Deinococcus aetherius]BDP43455.1 transcriptional regulator [Deinococcus aetherius]